MRTYRASDKALRDIEEVTITVAGKTRTYNIRRELSLAGDPDEVMAKHSLRVMFWNRVYQDAVSRRHRLEDLLAEREASLYLSYRDALERRGCGSTREEIMSNVRLNSTTMKAKKEIRLAYRLEGLLKSVCQAFEHRRTVMMKMWKSYE